MLNLVLATFLALPPMGAPAASPSEIDSLFPAPSGPLTLEVGNPDSTPTMESLVRQYCELTGQNVVVSQDSEGLMKQIRINLVKTLTVPADEVQTTFELLLRQNDFVLRLLKKDGVRLLELVSLSTSARNNLRASARYLAPDQLGLAKLHPAMLFTTVVTLPNTDVRQVSNSMRTMITDANTQQMLPAGNSNSMVLVGFGDSVGDLAEALQVIDAASATSGTKYVQTTEVISLENANAAELAGLLSRAFSVNPAEPRATDPKLLSDERTNSLLITATVGQLAAIKDLIAALDAK
ncbi:MAG: type II secretory pathway component GspD/PulD (secretin) [Planctomycetota bacterium]|jgi:type II secretory pathway component GspD/PulD (secretin)